MPRRQKAPSHDGVDGSNMASSHRRSQPEMCNQHPLHLRQSTSRSLTNPNVFSDDYALENETNNPELRDTSRSFRPLSMSLSSSSLHSAFSSSDLPTPTTLSSATNFEPPVNPFDDHNALSSFEHVPQATNARKSTGLLQRQSSTSTTFSHSHILRMSTAGSVSQYTGPSHPYGMYPQVGLSRSASIATSSARPSEATLQDSSAPQHPYRMYQQGTGTVQDEETAGITLGFPSSLQGYSDSYPAPMARPDDVGDIVGPDGHLEQLPPYSLYPAGIPSKRDGDTASTAPTVTDQPALAIPELDAEPLDESSTRTLVASDSNEDHPRIEPVSRLSPTEEEKVEQKATIRMCCGIPFWLISLVGAGMLVGGLIGGIIGGVLGERRAQAKFASSPSPGAPPPSVVTVTYISDVTPLPTMPPGTAPLPSGRYQVPVNINSMSRFCIDQNNQSWQCMNSGGMEIIVNPSTTPYPTVELPVPYFNTSNLTYGPQPPFLSSPTQSLTVMIDKQDPEYGPALFFESPFDKLVIVSESDFNPSKRDFTRMARYRWPSEQVHQSDCPWFCWWNSTSMEFFIFVNDPGPTLTSIITTTEGGVAYTSTKTQSASMGMETGADPDDPSSPAPIFPRRVKVEERRSIPGAPQPYCVQMVRSGTGYAPSTNTIVINEKPPPTGSSKRSYPREENELESFKLDVRSSVDSYSNSCYCDWLSD